MKNKRVFVSGGAGVIGLEMIPRLVELGATVIVGDLKPRPITFHENVIYRWGDLNTMTKEEFDQYAPEVFIHLAATFERSTESYNFWEENFLHNVRLSHHLMTLAKDSLSLSRVVFASSYLIYDPTLYQFNVKQMRPVSLKETDPIFPRNLTGMAKFAHEIELRFIDQFCGERLSTVCARIFRGYGKNSRDVISRWVRSLLKGDKITVFRPEGIFDYIYAADSAEGLIRLAAAKDVTGIINLGTGRSRSVQDVLDILQTHFPSMSSEIIDSNINYEASQADINKYYKLIGWKPKYDLPEAIGEIIDFERTKVEEAATNESIPLRILVTSASGKVPLIRAVQVALKKIDLNGKVVAGDINSEAITSYVSDEFWIMPPTIDESFDILINGLKERQIKIILPTRDAELLFWSRHSERLMLEGIKVLISKTESILRCIDKLEFSKFGLSNRLPFISSSDNIAEINSNRIVVKERFGAGSRSIAINVDRDQALNHASILENPIFQPFINGIEFSVDAWVDRKHKVKAVVLRQRNKVINGESQITTTFSNPQLEYEVIKIIEKLELSGPIVLQVILDVYEKIHVIECNARFGGASTAGIAAGLDIFYWSILEALGKDVTECSYVRDQREIRQIRIPTDIYVSNSNF